MEQLQSPDDEDLEKKMIHIEGEQEESSQKSEEDDYQEEEDSDGDPDTL
jgi:hypothetical protein